MRAVNLRMIGRFGNQLFAYAFAKGYAEKYGFELHCGNWIGRELFGLNDPDIEHDYPVRTEINVVPGESDITFSTYAMNQSAITYTRVQAKQWFSFVPSIQRVLDNIPIEQTLAHLRWGDFVGLSDFIAISKESIEKACEKFQIDFRHVKFVSEDNPCVVNGLSCSHSHFLPDFYRLMKASTLFRANSSFSWWAATLGDARRIFSPCLSGVKKQSGKTQDVEFVEGNHSAISAMHDFCSDLHL